MTYQDWNWLTPQMVINHFRRSPVLNCMADDVSAALKPLVGLEESQLISQLDQDLETITPHLPNLLDSSGKVKYGGQSLIARLLGGGNAGAFRESRVLPLVELIEATSTTSTPPADQAAPVEVRQAA